MVVNMSDVILIAGAFNSVTGDGKYVAAYDLNDDGAINMLVVLIIAGKFKLIINNTNTPTTTNTPTVTPRPTPSTTTYDRNGIIGTGQSLGVGASANPVKTTAQPYNNLKLSLGSLKVPPFDPNSTQLKMVPLVEPIRNFATGYPAPYLGNLFGEPPHSSNG
ncbi:MAG TPA: hypothetical protein VIO64_19245 [Pseudobacteroides sp.]|uniref:hypothetical protein n=1 Tax=Pseudobacteroides sp. TaxID=1968840 RepID=UPI002F955B3E